MGVANEAAISGDKIRPQLVTIQIKPWVNLMSEVAISYR